MTDKNSPLDDDDLREMVNSLSDHTGLNEPYARFWRLGQLSGHAFNQLGSNVPMAYFHAGTAFKRLAIPAGAEVERCSAAFYDGFTDFFWTLATDKQKEGPYA